MNLSAERTREIIAKAAKEAFLLSAADLQRFAERENLRISESDLEAGVQKLSAAVSEAVAEILRHESQGQLS